MAHKEQSELLSEIDGLRQRINIGDRYYHYKHPDQFYSISSLGFLEATEQLLIGYEAEYGDKLTWFRTPDEFFAKVEVDGKEVARFTKVS